MAIPSSPTVVVLLLALSFVMPHCTAGQQAVMVSGDPLFRGNMLDNGQYRLIMQEDCNLVLYNIFGIPVWATNTGRSEPSNCFLSLTSYGRLQVCDGAFFSCNTVWQTDNEFGTGRGCVLVLVDASLQIYCTPLWDTGKLTATGASSSAPAADVAAHVVINANASTETR